MPNTQALADAGPETTHAKTCGNRDDAASNSNLPRRRRRRISQTPGVKGLKPDMRKSLLCVFEGLSTRTERA